MFIYFKEENFLKLKKRKEKNQILTELKNERIERIKRIGVHSLIS